MMLPLSTKSQWFYIEQKHSTSLYMCVLLDICWWTALLIINTTSYVGDPIFVRLFNNTSHGPRRRLIDRTFLLICTIIETFICFPPPLVILLYIASHTCHNLTHVLQTLS